MDRTFGRAPTVDVEKCARCGAKRSRLRPDQCAVCLGMVWVRGAFRPSHPQLPPGSKGPFPWAQPPLVPGTGGAVYGGKGAGKSTLLALLLDDPDRDLWITAEEETALVARRHLRLRGGGANIDPAIDEVHTLQDLERVIVEREHLPTRRVVLDSASRMGAERDQLRAVYMLYEAAQEFGWLTVSILQITRAGTARGVAEIEHAVDWVAMVGKKGHRYLTFDKNRLDALTTVAWKFTDEGLPVPLTAEGGIFSVEGDDGDYRLQRFPIGPARWADPWVVAGKSYRGLAALRRLDGVATAAVWAPSDPCLFVEPLEDAEERRRFARACGQRWIGADELRHVLEIDDPLDKDPGDGRVADPFTLPDPPA